MKQRIRRQINKFIPNNRFIKTNNHNNITKTYSQLTSILNSERYGSSIGYENLKTTPGPQLRNYRSWVFSCVSLISDRTSSIPYYFYNKNTGAELTSSNKGYKIFTKPFFKPNDLMSFRFIKAFCQIQLDLCGISCIYKSYNKLGQVWELWPLNMNDLISIDSDNSIVNPTIEYSFNSGNGYIEFNDNELIVLKYPHPTDISKPMSPIQAQAYATDIDSYIEIYERDFFKNSARIDFALTTDASLDQEKADEIKQRWVEKHQGRFFDIAVLDSGLKPVPLKFTNKDFEFLSLADWSKEKVCSAYRIPSDKIGGKVANRAGAVYTDINFNRESIEPRLNIWDEELTIEILSSFDDRIIVKHDNPIPRDRLIEVQEHKTYLSGAPSMSLNEYRREYQKLPPVKGGDIILVKKDMIPLDMLRDIVKQELNNSKVSNGRDRSNDDPHLNPDGTDNRDDNPTPGRSFNNANLKEFNFVFNKLKIIWFDCLNDQIKISKDELLEINLNKAVKSCIILSVFQLFKYWKFSEKVNLDMVWIGNISDKMVKELVSTEINIKNGTNLNARFYKIINSLIRATINYSKYVILENKKLEKNWVINNNECGHKERLENLKSFDFFKIGGRKLRFPNEDINFSCDCTLTD